MFLFIFNVRVFIGPKSFHCLPNALTDLYCWDLNDVTLAEDRQRDEIEAVNLVIKLNQSCGCVEDSPWLWLFIKANLNKLGCVKHTIVITTDTCMYIFQPALLYLCNDALHSHPSEASPECLRYWCIEEVHMPLAHLISSREIVGRIGV